MSFGAGWGGAPAPPACVVRSRAAPDRGNGGGDRGIPRGRHEGSHGSPLRHPQCARAQRFATSGGCPAAATKRPGLLVFLHGKGQNQESNLSGQFFAALAALGTRAPDVVFPYGGEDSYWHDRDSGAWGKYLLREVIPQAIQRLHADPRRVAIGGLSMGGFGAYDLARLAPGKFCAVGGDSAALWLHPGETAAGAFDDQEDFERNDVVGEAGAQSEPYPGASLWLDVGSEDPFRAADTALAAALRAKNRKVEFHIWPGGHEDSYWNSHWSAYLRFYADALEHCGSAGDG